MKRMQVDLWIVPSSRCVQSTNLIEATKSRIWNFYTTFKIGL